MTFGAGLFEMCSTTIGKIPIAPQIGIGEGVFAGQNLSTGARSKPFHIKELICENKHQNDKIFLTLDKKGYLFSEKVKSWKTKISPSPDVHSCNLHLDIVKNSSSEPLWMFRLIKNVPIGSEIFMWFSEEISALIDMPFLTPKNISGHKQYCCHICDEAFEYPNPLKIHLLLSCGKYSLNYLWAKLDSIVGKVQYQKSVIDFQRCISEPPRSAFTPYKKGSGENNEPLNLSMPEYNNYGNLELRLSRSLDELSGNYAADVELFASNWGKTKQGHLCVYCGKIYSRKYGLKIHIRTHTGYKPLKCKYCLRPFGDPSNLNKHVRLHASGLTPYICNICGKVMVRRRDLDRHLKSYHSRVIMEGMKES